ncbi:protein FAR1-RELATED SEQUENCE 3-like [Telopea speciosissima]|uniref:protein FAR1-RELATED SEQUENCE 3-like n=1 Tax=Telopea speciosissima TaxID=54955 RepID=UPI001CC6FD6D|nr:protein FAR1-RELATED SEQUENCE 3-like [Telopea speciosissima]
MEDTLFLQLHKLSPVTSEETLEQIFNSLWKSRRTGLKAPEKAYMKSLLNLSSLEDIDPVLACLRSLIRKSVNENFNGDSILKLFPDDLALELQSILLALLQKYQNQWKEDASKDQTPWPRTNATYQVKASTQPSFTPFPASDMSTSMWPRQDDPIVHFNRNDDASTTPVDDINASHVAPVSLQRDDGLPDNLGMLPRLKSMTWTMENRNSRPANRVAVISLKLQDYTKSPLGETEVRFQLTRDTLEALLRSMAYISEQLSMAYVSEHLTNIVECSSEPLQKKQRQ